MKKDPLKINFLHAEAEQKARRTTILAAGLFTLFVGLLSAFGAGASFQAASHGTTVLSEVGRLLTFSEVSHFNWSASADTTDDPFATPDGRLNILLLGIGGGIHDGPQLTDTIILASLDRAQKRVGLVSIPRDLAYPLGGGRFEKINAVNAYAEQEHPGEGAKRTAQSLEKLFNTRIDRVVRIDFKGFTDFVDALGGVDIDVEHSFTDYLYPTDDSGPNPYQYQTITFKKGPEHMSGQRALTYVRSRHGNNGEGGDFARSRRQQLLVEAIRSKVLSLGTLSNPKLLTDLWTAVSSHVQSDLSAWDMLKLAPLALNFSTTNITSRVMTDGPDGELVPTTVGGAYMEFPRKPDWSEIRDIISNPFTTKEEIASQNHAQEPATIEIRNGTFRTGFASQVADKLTDLGYTVASTGNASHRGYEKTVIYDLTNGQKTANLATLRKLLDANIVSFAPSSDSLLTDNGGRERVNATSTHFLIILGDSSFGLVNPYYASTQNP